MTRRLLVFFLVAALTAPAFAAERKSRFGFWGGYTTVSMADVNDTLKNTLPAGGVTEIKDGIEIAAEYLFGVSPGFSLGPRVEYQILTQGKNTLNTPVLNTEINENLYLYPVLFGGRYVFLNTGAFDLSLGLFAGWGFASGKTVNKTQSPLLPGVTTETTTKFSGGGAVGNVLLGAEFRLAGDTYLTIDAGYRSANIPEMNVDSTGTTVSSGGGDGGGGGGGGYAPFASNAPVKDSAGNTLKYDFSGAIANIGLSFRF